MNVITNSDGIKITDKHVFFFSNKCPFSNFYHSEFSVNIQNDDYFDNMVFGTSEQYFMWKKAVVFCDDEMTNAIGIANDNPKLCKEMGRKVKGYDEDVWDRIRFDVMFDANMFKFSQNDELKKYILDKRFDGKIFAEASPDDGIWGIHMRMNDSGIDNEANWNGQNLMGKVINAVRERLISDSDESDRIFKDSEDMGDYGKIIQII